jgi:hypothetical protein
MSSWKGNERSVKEQILTLSEPHLAAYNTLKVRHLADITERKAADEQFLAHTDYSILRFIRASPGREKFNVESAFAVMQK